MQLLSWVTLLPPAIPLGALSGAEGRGLHFSPALLPHLQAKEILLAPPSKQGRFSTVPSWSTLSSLHGILPKAPHLPGPSLSSLPRVASQSGPAPTCRLLPPFL